MRRLLHGRQTIMTLKPHFEIESMYITKMDSTYSVHLTILKGQALVKVQFATNLKPQFTEPIMQAALELFPKILGGPGSK